MGQPLATQVASIAACLPEQFISTGAFDSPARISSSRAVVVQRPVRRRLEGVLVEAGGGQDAAYALDVEGLPGVRGARQREQLAVEVESPPRACPSAWIGLLHERGSIGLLDVAGGGQHEPSRSSTTQEP